LANAVAGVLVRAFKLKGGFADFRPRLDNLPVMANRGYAEIKSRMSGEACMSNMPDTGGIQSMEPEPRP
jgi:hypothetical protein